MTEALPSFTYHPDPLRTGAVAQSEVVCVCCSKARGFIYVAPVYAKDDLNERLCPWCIADGSAATKFDASFSDDWRLHKAGVPFEVINEVAMRTPGYFSWQSESWLSHCADACEFHGDASEGEVANASDLTKIEWQREYDLNEDDWKHATAGYVPRGHQAFYKFVCRHCSLVLLGWDCS
ncbi:CbrC family protein [Piscinibacter gummiphilus]|uniref:CbrC family protein n=1 Tax=Piscinibacter gummiphilus TaxID=946333 RepID=UPI0039B993C3